MKILIESAVALEADQKTEIETILGKKHKGAEFAYEVNQSILGGLRVTVGSKRIDLSLKGKLDQVGMQLE